jgi:hypothetical protein
MPNLETLNTFRIKFGTEYQSIWTAKAALLEKDKQTFGRVIHTETARDFYQAVLDTTTEQIHPMEESDIVLRRPGGLDTKSLQADQALAKTLPKDTALVVLGHGSLGINDNHFEWGPFNSSRDWRASYVDRASYSGSALRGQGFLQKMADRAEAIDLETTDYESLTVLLGKKANNQLGSGTNIEASTRANHFLFEDHAQCGARLGSLGYTIREFMDYSTQLLKEDKDSNVVPAIELVEGYFLGLDMQSLRQGKLIMKVYTPEGFDENLASVGLDKKKKIHCVDERTPHNPAEGSGFIDLAKRSAEYNQQDPNYNPRVVDAISNRTLIGDHHEVVIIAASCENPMDRSLARIATEHSQCLCDFCASVPRRPQAKEAITAWVGPTAKYELMSNTSGEMAYLASTREVVKGLENITGLYNTVGGGLSRDHGVAAWRGIHMFGGRTLTGFEIGEGSLAETTLVRPAMSNIFERPASPMLIVTRAIAEEIGGAKRLLDILKTDQYYYGAVALLDPDTKHSEIISYTSPRDIQQKAWLQTYPFNRIKYHTVSPDGETRREADFLEDDFRRQAGRSYR